ncbi:MAG: magnesium transporter [Elusimicrobia bacterium RIFCSPLOWO2_12_FULL_59_9]|nr:MAG: magnesium transporter [Elusimicrobia bacterium RIFCSPLOWO2_12_FULL_59_9]
MLGRLIQPDLEDLIAHRNFSALREAFSELSAPDISDIITDLPKEDQAVVFRLLPRKLAAEVFEYLKFPEQERLLRSLADEQAAEILNTVSADDRTAFLEELPAEATKHLLSLLSPPERERARRLLGYPEGSVGRLMTPDYLAIRESWRVSDVLEHVRRNGHDSETLNVLYVVDSAGRLIDDLRVREFLLAPLEKPVAELMTRQFETLKAADDQRTAVAAFRRLERVALPVIDSEGVLVGIVTIDDVLQVAEQKATEDFQRFGATAVFEEPYLKIALSKIIGKRAGWLIILFLGELFTATAMGYFEKEIARAVVLALFIPLIISSGGNSGSQASTLVVRALALGEISPGDWFKIVRRETICGLALGMILGAIGFLRISIWSAFFNLYGPHWFWVAVTVGLALTGVVLWGSLVGSVLPLAIKKLGGDPAVSSAPFVATMVDVTGLIVYFSVAAFVLRGTLL